MILFAIESIAFKRARTSSTINFRRKRRYRNRGAPRLPLRDDFVRSLAVQASRHLAGSASANSEIDPVILRHLLEFRSIQQCGFVARPEQQRKPPPRVFNFRSKHRAVRRHSVPVPTKRTSRSFGRSVNIREAAGFRWHPPACARTARATCGRP